jgi:hypothetical protein
MEPGQLLPFLDDRLATDREQLGMSRALGLWAPPEPWGLRERAIKRPGGRRTSGAQQLGNLKTHTILRNPPK